jgi:prepilin-type N-terminal cleavage/methylation domain-containing protein
MKLNRKGFTLVEIMIVVAIIALLAAIAIPAFLKSPSFLKSRQESRRSTCINNLRLLDHAKQQWATKEQKQQTDTPADTDLGPYLKNGYPSCPSGGSYTIGAVSANPTCDQAEHAL